MQGVGGTAAWRISLSSMVLGLGLSQASAQSNDEDLDALFGAPPSQSQPSPSPTPQPAAETATITLDEQAQPSPRPAHQGRVLEEIIVTAQKRAQNLTDVPISVSALSGEKLRDAGIENLSDLSEYAPNFKLVEGGLVPLI